MKPTDHTRRASGGGRGESVHHYSPGELHHDDVAHEDTDVNIRQLVVFAIGLALVVGVVFVLMLGLFRVLSSQADSADVQASGVAAPATQMPTTTTGSPYFGTARGPQLLTNEPRLLAEIRDRERQQLATYGWVNQGGGVARLPIEEAKKLVATRGLPVRPQPVDELQGTILPARGESTSGRLITGKPPAAGAEPAAAPPGAAKPAEPHKGGH